MSAVSRTLLAVLDYNDNCQRQQKQTKNGDERWHRQTRKWELNVAKLVPVEEAKSFGKISSSFLFWHLQSTLQA